MLERREHVTASERFGRVVGENLDDVAIPTLTSTVSGVDAAQTGAARIHAVTG